MAFIAPNQPGQLVQQPQLISQAPVHPISNPQMIPTNSIKYQQPQQPIVYQNQPTAITSSRVPATIQQPIVQTTKIPTQVHASATPVQYQAAATSNVITTSGCPPPVQGQPIVIEGGITGAQAYMEPVRQTVLLQGAQVRPELSQVKLGEKRIEHIPYEQVVTEYDELEKRIRIPINKYITEYQVIDHQIEYHPEISYQTEVDYKPSQRVEEEVQYQTQEKRIDVGFVQGMRTSQRIEGAVNVTSSVHQPTIVQSTQPIAVQQQTYSTIQAQASPVVQTQVYPVSQAYSNVVQPVQAYQTTTQQPQFISQPGIQYKAKKKSS